MVDAVEALMILGSIEESLSGLENGAEWVIYWLL